ncbi:MAG: glycosyltransferase [Deltaproteobacteria bacterium]|nr:glycosyltransferase [Deltaproteobacteria bacterium]
MDAPAPSAIPRLSVVVPAYNARATLGSCLEGLLAQSAPRESYEIIVVDDGSSDGTGEVARSFPVRYLRQDNRGPAAARNLGAREARGEIVLFTDSDCTPDAGWLERMVAPLDDPRVVAVKGSYKTRQGSLAARFAQAEFEDRYDLLGMSTSIDMIDTYSAAFRREVFVAMGGFDESFPVANNEDTDLSYRLSRAGHRLVFARDAFVYHRHPDTFRKYLRTKFWRGYWRMVVYRRYPDKALKDTYTPVSLKLQTLAMAASFPALVLAPVVPLFGRIALTAWAAVFALSAPFARKAYRLDRAIGLIAPLAVFARSAVFAGGSLLGLVRCVFGSRVREMPVSKP